MTPFDLRLTKMGHPVCTKEGNSVRIICYNKKGVYPLVGLISSNNEELVVTYTEDGKFYASGRESPKDLMMKTTRHEAWINIYPDYIGGIKFPTKEKAIECADNDRITTIKIEWEQ